MDGVPIVTERYRLGFEWVEQSPIRISKSAESSFNQADWIMELFRAWAGFQSWNVCSRIDDWYAVTRPSSSLMFLM